jgi:protein-disulfide isomerase
VITFENTASTNARWRSISLALTGVGWSLSAFLLLSAIVLRAAPQVRLTDKLCPGCASPLTADVGWQLGFPLAAWALVYFAITGFLLVHAGRSVVAAAWAISAAGIGAGLVLTVSLFLNGFSDCLPRLAVHVINLALFSALSFAAARQSSPTASPLQRWPIHSRSIMSAALVLAGGVAETAMSPPWRAMSLVQRAYWAEPAHPIPTDSADASRGAADNAVRLVVFSSFQCPGCQVFAHVLQHLDERFAGRLTTVFKHFPLGKACNPLLPFDLQPRSCAAAEAAEAANRLHAFWRFHDSIFGGSLEASEGELQTMATNSGLALEQWNIERARPAVREKIHRDIELARRLGVDGTPAVFLNGRKVSDLGLANLETLIRKELAMRASARR